MKKIITICFCLFLTVFAFCNTLFDGNNSNVFADNPSYNVTKINLTLPSNVKINSLSTINGNTFYFTNNSTNFYSATETKYENFVFKDLENTNYRTTNLGVYLNNNISFVYSRTEQFANQNIFELYKINENGQTEQDPYYFVYPNSTATNYSTNLSQISDMCFDYYNNLYLLDINNKAILTFNYENDRIEIFKNLSLPIENLGLIELNENSKMCSTINGQSIFILTNNKVYKLTTQTKNIEEILINTQIDLNNITDFSCDAGENLYFLSSQTPTSTIYKQTKQKLVSSINLNHNISEMFIEEFTGEMYYIIQNEIFVLNYANFIASTIRHPSPINFNEKEYISEDISFALTKENTQLLVSPYALTETLLLEEDSLILVLQNSLLEEPNFTYCLFEQNNQQTFGYILTNQIKEYSTFIEYSQEPKSTFVITNAYKYPTKSSPRLTTINKNTTANILGFYKFTNSEINLNFYKVQIGDAIENKTAFIDKDLVFSQNIEEITYTGGTPTPNKYKKFTEYLLIIFALTILEIVTIVIIVKKVKINKKNTD